MNEAYSRNARRERTDRRTDETKFIGPLSALPRVQKLQYDINREAEKISALSSGKIDKYEYLTGEEILPSNQQQITEQAKVTYSPLGEAFEKQIKEQVKAIKDLNISDEVNELKQIENILSKDVISDLITTKLKKY